MDTTIVAPDIERLRVDMVISENTSQTVVRGKIVVPDPKPDVEKILSVDKTISVKDVRLLPNKVVVEGVIHIQVVYVAFKPDQSVHHFHDQVKFTTFVDLPGALPGMEVRINVAVEDLNIVRSSGCAGKFDVAAVVALTAKVTEIQEMDVITQCPSGCTCETETIEVDHVVGSNSRQVIISDVFEVPQQKPPVEKILDTDAKVDITVTKVLKNKVIFDGEVTVQVLYVGLLPEQPVHQMHHTFKFSDFVEVPGAEQGMNVRYNIMLENVDVDMAGGNNPDLLQANLVVKLTANVVELREVDVLTDISGCNIEPEFTLLKMDSLVGESSSQVVLKDTFYTPEPKPNVEKILDTTVDDIKITEKKVIRDKVIVKGYVDVQIVYVAALSDQPVHATNRRILFNSFVEIIGAREDLDVEVTVDTEFITATHENCSITVEMVLKINGRVTECMQREVVTSIGAAPPEEVPTGPPCPPGENFSYVVQEGDTLYSIGLKYGVPVDQMIAANPQLADPANISAGITIQVPCVPKG